MDRQYVEFVLKVMSVVVCSTDFNYGDSDLESGIVMTQMIEPDHYLLDNKQLQNWGQVA